MQEIKDIAKMNFRFKEKSSPCNYVHFIAKSLPEYPIEEILTASTLFIEWKPELVEMVLGYLTPKNIRVHVIAQAYEDIAEDVEPWYKTKYKKEKIPAEVIEKWSNAGYNSDLKLPALNEFIPTKFDLKLDNSVVSLYLCCII